MSGKLPPWKIAPPPPVGVMVKIWVRGGGNFPRTVLTVSYASWKCMSLEIRISCNSQTFWISLSMKDNSFSLQLWRDTRKRALVQANRLYINYNIIAISLGVVQKVRSLKTSSFWPPHSPLVRSCLCYMSPPPPSLLNVVRYSELPSPPLIKSSATLMALISNR